MIPLLEPFLGGNESRYVQEALAANQIAQGPFIERFEQAFAQYVGSQHAVAVSSGTAALHLAMRILDVGPGDEVLAPTFTFVATVNPILYQGAKPVLVDAEREGWGVDSRSVKNLLLWGDRPKAIVVAHLYGHPAADVQMLLALANKYSIPLIEDAAESLGARMDGRQVGTFGKVGCFSFNGNKIITTGGGGMLVTDDWSLAGRARHLRAQAKLPGLGYLHDEIGYNYRITNLSAAVGLAQLEQLPVLLSCKRAIAERYPYWDKTSSRWLGATFWLYSALFENRDVVQQALMEEGIESRPLWTPIHTMAPYKHCRYLGGTVAEDLHARGLSLPSSVGLTAADQQRVIDAVKKGLDRAA